MLKSIIGYLKSIIDSGLNRTVRKLKPKDSNIFSSQTTYNPILQKYATTSSLGFLYTVAQDIFRANEIHGHMSKLARVV